MATIEIICRDCGAGNPPGTQFCAGCGQYIFDPATATMPAQPPAGPISGAGTPAPTAPVGASEQAVSQPSQQWARYCTWCGAGNPVGRHLCRRCGQLLDTSDGWVGPNLVGLTAAAGGTNQLGVPGWYRGRAVIAVAVALAVAILIGISVVSIPRITEAWAGQRRGEQTVPATASLESAPKNTKIKVSMVTDGSEEGVTLPWKKPKTIDCAKPGTAWIVMQFAEPTLITRLAIKPGLEAGNPLQASELMPVQVSVRYGDAPCTIVNLEPDGWTSDGGSAAKTQKVRVAVLAVRGGDDLKQQVTITEILAYTSER